MKNVAGYAYPVKICKEHLKAVNPVVGGLCAILMEIINEALEDVGKYEYNETNIGLLNLKGQPPVRYDQILAFVIRELAQEHLLKEAQEQVNKIEKELKNE